jgi:hypothetical protein
MEQAREFNQRLALDSDSLSRLLTRFIRRQNSLFDDFNAFISLMP